MAEYFKVEFSYPDGHTEEFDEKFSSLEAAIKFAKDLMNQVGFNERAHDEGADKELSKPHYWVIKVTPEGKELAFDSRK